VPSRLVLPARSPLVLTVISICTQSHAAVANVPVTNATAADSAAADTTAAGFATAADATAADTTAAEATAAAACRKLLAHLGAKGAVDEALDPGWTALGCPSVMLRGSGSAAQLLVGAEEGARVSAPSRAAGALAAPCRTLLEQMDQEPTQHPAQRQLLEAAFTRLNCSALMMQGDAVEQVLVPWVGADG